MPQPTQHSLIHVLLLWTTILSIIQVVFIILIFTGGHHGLCQNNEASGGAMQIKSPPENSLLKGKMLTFRGTEVNTTGVKWKARSLGSGLLSEEGDNLTIKMDGYYFLSLQVTLSSCKEDGLQSTVSLKLGTKVLLQGTINRNTCSTGLLGKVEELSAGGQLVVIISPQNTSTNINSNESLTHLDVIYMPKP